MWAIGPPKELTPSLAKTRSTSKGEPERAYSLWLVDPLTSNSGFFSSIRANDNHRIFQRFGAGMNTGTAAQSLRGLGTCRPRLATPHPELRDPPRDDVKHRREYQPERGHPDHAGEHRGAERLAQFSAGADRPDQRRDAEDESERCHQDRAQPQPRRFDRGLPARAALVLELTGEFDDQDGVLGGEPDQHHEADLSEDVVVPAAQDDAGDGGNKAHRHAHAQ